jgi:hypothetical protein
MPSSRTKGKSPPIISATIQHPELTEVEMQSGPHPRSHRRIPRQIENWIERCKVLGLQTRQLVWELHVCQGHSKIETARLLDITRAAVWQHYEAAKREIYDRAPKNPEEFAAKREEIYDRLLSTYEEACKRTQVKTIDQETGEEVLQELDADPRNLAIRLKCLDQMAKLHGLNLERETGAGDEGKVYATPEDIALAVQARALAVHGRAGDVQAAVKALTNG